MDPEREPGDGTDPRVAAVLQVLGGQQRSVVARRWSVEPALLDRWVAAFVGAGSAQLANRPDPRAAEHRDRFLAAVAHELRSPLTIAQGWLAMLMDDDAPAPATRGALARLDTALRTLVERTTDLELLAATSLGRLSLSTTVLGVGELVSALADLDVTTGQGMEIEVEVDPDRFTRVLRDLWRAAASEPVPRSLRLEAASVPPWVELRVVRDADPLDPRVLQAWFEPFEANDDGTGVTIGLYLARALTVAHGGTIGVDQDEHGAVLWVRLPEPSGHAATHPEETTDDLQDRVR